MSKTINVSLNGLVIGDLPLVDNLSIPAADASHGANQLTNPLMLSNGDGGGKLELRYRHIQSAQRDNGAVYEIGLGAIVAASAIVFSTPVISAPASLNLLLLLRDEDSAQQDHEGLSAVLVEPARDGNTHTARLASDDKQDALTAEAEKQPLDVKPTDNDASDLAAIVSTALQSFATCDVCLPIETAELDSVYLTLPSQLPFGEDGVLYFRDAMNGEADFLFNRQGDFEQVQVVLSVTGGYFYVLEEGEEFFDREAIDADDLAALPDTAVLTFRAEDLEAQLSRAVAIPAVDADTMRIDIEIFAADQLVLEDSVTIDLTPFLDGVDTDDIGHLDSSIDMDAGLPEEEAPLSGATTGYAREDNGLFDEADYDDVNKYPPEIL